MTIKCSASIYTAYYKVAQISVVIKAKPKLKRRRDELVLKDKDPQKGESLSMTYIASDILIRVTLLIR